MSASNAIQSVRSLRQTYQGETEKHPVKEIDPEAAGRFNKLLNELKKIYPDNRSIVQMEPLTPGKTQMAGLWAKLDVLEDLLQAP